MCKDKSSMRFNVRIFWLFSFGFLESVFGQLLHMSSRFSDFENLEKLNVKNVKPSVSHSW